MRIRSDSSRKGFLWFGVHGQATATLNGERILEEQNAEPCHVGKFKVPVELKSGENLLVFQMRGQPDQPRISALLVGSRNDGDTVEGIRSVI
jgi:hypothetical protein